MSTTTDATPQYALTDDQIAIRSMVRQITEEQVAPRAAEIDAKGEYPHDLRKLFGEQGLFGLVIPEEYGGTHTEEGCGTLTLNLAIEEVSKACASSALMLMVAELSTLSIRLAGTHEQKQQWLPSVATGETSGAFGLSEPAAGSDPGSMITNAVRDGDEYVINGSKSWITNASIADWYLVFAVTDKEQGKNGISAFVVEADRPGFEVVSLEHKLGIKGSPTGTLAFDDVRVPVGNRIGDEGEGFKIAMRTLDRSRLGVAAQGLGIAQGALDYAAAYTKERKAFGKPLSSFQAVSGKLADAAIGCAAGRELMFKAATMIDREEPGFGMWSSMAKVFNSDHAMRTTVEMVQVMGGSGYVKDYPLERMMRDAKITQIYEGANEINRIVIARGI
ncbi:MAG: acyl-CoA dehydrogenase family protein [Actinomycetes bacterium]